MREATFIGMVEQAGGITREDAQRAIRATLQTLGERITRGEADDIAVFLPGELRGLLASGPERAEAFGLDEFIRRVADREGVDLKTAYQHAQAVLVALAQAVAPGELKDLAAQLSKDFDPLLEATRTPRDAAVPQDQLIRRVAELTSLETPRARRAVEAVLEALAIRISQGEVEDLMRWLPPDLIPSLEHGLAQSRRATRMSLEEFLDRVAKLEGVDRAEAETHARAVLAALRELVPAKEIYDVESELPREYAPLFANVL